MESSSVDYGRTTIEYQIQRGRREKTVAVAVDPVDGVLVRAPKDTPIDKLDQIVHRKARWIVDTQRRCDDLPPRPAPRRFVSGETFRYLGRQYRLQVRTARVHEDESVKLVGGYLCVRMHRPNRSEQHARQLLTTWYRKQASRRLPPRVEYWAARLDVRPNQVLIRDQRKRWGSADSAGDLRFNWRIVQATLREIDYVVVHELTHLRHRDHTRTFWTALGQVLPDYEDRRRILRQSGSEYSWTPT